MEIKEKADAGLRMDDNKYVKNVK